MSTNNPPEVIVEMSRELADFVIENCDTNIEFGLKAMMAIGTVDDGSNKTRESLEKLVTLNENFKALKNAVKKGMS